MGASTASFVTTVVVGIVITLVVGVLLRRIGRDFLAEVYGDRSLSTSLNYLLVTLYYLFALGLLTLVAGADLGLAGVVVHLFGDAINSEFVRFILLSLRAGVVSVRVMRWGSFLSCILAFRCI